ncbi:TrkH family potassium uptake protein [Candidatus Nitronereus thalassa]|uniref:TrkH family potassium uptake protein n=1 Tax=Candidatus Nitronereus thalassa TaxID=3020898 RepID=A0ABU3KAV8_9BACT|nr:TrkH family potassium uptake protein [Candidatus Nitronereus thalassa]MDT7043438.1 TrkH family potassium uptake protein [Candidatus Nitronereus thalassa]
MALIDQTGKQTPSILTRLLTLRLLPGQIVALAAAALILLGSLLLMLPAATPPTVNIRFIDALFTATSAVCVTGLVVLDTPTEFTVFGQLVILMLIQIGGLGYALMATMILLALGHRIGLRDRMMLAETLSVTDIGESVRYVKIVAIVTVFLEGFGAILLTLRFSQDMSWGQALYAGIFHSISAFNNAGFALFSNSLISYQSDFSINMIVTILVIFGSIGFIVFQDLWDNFTARRFRFQTHTKLVVVVTLVLLVSGTLGIMILEWNNPRTFGPLSLGERFAVAHFHTVSRTAGFTTINIGDMEDATLYFLILLMTVGGSPGSMSGGIKTTTFAIIWLTIWAVLWRKVDVEVFHRRIPPDLIIRAFVLCILAFTAITLFTLLLDFSEERPFLRIMFEVTSAMGIVGMSFGDGGSRSLSALLTDFGKVVIIMSMLLGRFGPLLIGLFAVKTSTPVRYRYPESKVLIG